MWPGTCGSYVGVGGKRECFYNTVARKCRASIWLLVTLVVDYTKRDFLL